MNESARPVSKPQSRPRRVWEFLKTRWGVTGWGAVMILATFSLSGISVLKLAYPIVHLVVPDDAPRWQYYTIKLLIVVPIYEVLLLVWGTLLGQRRFFWLKLLQTGRFLARPFRRGRR